MNRPLRATAQAHDSSETRRARTQVRLTAQEETRVFLGLQRIARRVALADHVDARRLHLDRLRARARDEFAARHDRTTNVETERGGATRQRAQASARQHNRRQNEQKKRTDSTNATTTDGPLTWLASRSLPTPTADRRRSSRR